MLRARGGLYYLFLASVSFLVAFAFSLQASAALVDLLVLDRDSLHSVTLKKADVSVKLDEFTMKTDYELTFVNQFRGAQEGTFYFNLPRGSIVDEFGLWVNGVYQSSAIVKARDARVAYETIVRRGVDPALLEWSSGNVFKMRVFPVFPNQETKLRLTLINQVEGSNGNARFSFPLGFKSLEQLSLNISGEFATEQLPKLEGLRDFRFSEERKENSFGRSRFGGSQVYEKPQAPPAEVSLTFPMGSSDKSWVQFEEMDGDRYIELNNFPDLKALQRPPAQSSLIIWDSSLSEEKNHDDRLKFLQRYLDERKPQLVRLVRFATQVENEGLLFNGTDFANLKRAIGSRPYDGATRIDRLVRALPELLGKKDAYSDVILFTNAVDSFEFEDFKNTALLPSAAKNSFIVTSREGSNETILRVLSRLLGASVIDEDQVDDSKVLTEIPWMISAVSSKSGISSIYCNPEGLIFSGDMLTCRGKFKRDGKNNLNVELRRDKETSLLKFDFSTGKPSTGNRSAISKRWAQARISGLMFEKKENSLETEELSLKHQLMSPFVARVVLEACEDYVEFNLPRPTTCKNRPVDDINNPEYLDDFYEADSRDLARDYPANNRDANSVGNRVRLRTQVSYGEYNVDKTQFEFEGIIAAAAAKGAAALEAAYFKQRKSSIENPFYYFFVAHQFLRLKNVDRAAEVLSNVVENRPSDARWLRVYGHEILNWGRVDEAVSVFAEVIALRDDEPHSYRDYALALEKAGRFAEALNNLQRVMLGIWDNRFEGILTVVEDDLDRVARRLLAARPSAQEKAKALKHVRGDSERARISAVIFWDSDNTNLDLQVLSLGGRDISKTEDVSEPQGISGGDSVSGFGPDFRRLVRPYIGEYRFVVTYRSGNSNVTQDGTFVWSEFTITENGREMRVRKTHFLRYSESEQTMHVINYNDKNARVPPESIYTVIDRANKLMGQKNYPEMRKYLMSIDADQYSGDFEAMAEFNFLRGYAEGKLKNYAEAIRFTQFSKINRVRRFLPLADYNSACFAALSGKKTRALMYLEEMSKSLRLYAFGEKEIRRFIELLKQDDELKSVRVDSRFQKILSELTRIVAGLSDY